MAFFSLLIALTIFSLLDVSSGPGSSDEHLGSRHKTEASSAPAAHLAASSR